MDQGVPHPAEGRVAAARELGTEPGEEGEGGVVHHVQRGQVRPLTPQNEEDRVEEVNELGEVEPPGQGQRPLRLGLGGVVHGLAHPAVAAPEPEGGGAWSWQQLDTTS